MTPTHLYQTAKNRSTNDRLICIISDVVQRNYLAILILLIFVTGADQPLNIFTKSSTLDIAAVLDPLLCYAFSREKQKLSF